MRSIFGLKMIATMACPIPASIGYTYSQRRQNAELKRGQRTGKYEIWAEY